MKLPEIYLLALASIVSLSFFYTDHETPIKIRTDRTITLKSAIEEANEKVGTDSVYLSAFSDDYQPDQYLITDHLVLVNDLAATINLLSKDISFSIEPNGYLELVDFNLKEMEAQIINKGSMSLNNCRFQEGKNLTNLITNEGAFSITNGLFVGSPEGEIIRDAEFSYGVRIIL